jgi:hypothetical protein
VDWNIGGFDFFWNAGSVGGGLAGNSASYAFEVSASVSNVFFEHTGTHIGIELNLAKIFWYYAVTEQQWKQQVHFLNGTIYWNPLTFENIILGPCMAIHYLTQNNDGRFDGNGFLWSTGLRFFWRTRSHAYYKICFQKAGIEVGYGNNQGDHRFYGRITMDITVTLAALVVYVLGNA